VGREFVESFPNGQLSLVTLQVFCGTPTGAATPSQGANNPRIISQGMCGFLHTPKRLTFSATTRFYLLL